MRTSFPRLLLTAGLTVGLFQAVQAQTARITHFSHSGSSAGLDAAMDNFGNIRPHFEVDSIRYISDTTLLEYGEWVGYSTPKEKVRTYQFSSRLKGNMRVPAIKYIDQQARYHEHFKVVGYDTLPKATPTLKKQKTKRKKTAFVPTATAPPRHPGVALTVAIILTLAGAGWLLGERRPAQPQAA